MIILMILLLLLLLLPLIIIHNNNNNINDDTTTTTTTNDNNHTIIISVIYVYTWIYVWLHWLQANYKSIDNWGGVSSETSFVARTYAWNIEISPRSSHLLFKLMLEIPRLHAEAQRRSRILWAICYMTISLSFQFAVFSTIQCKFSGF